MSTPVLLDGFRICVYAPPREHGPAHVHVLKDGAEVLIELAPVAVKEVRGKMKDADIVKAFRIVEEHTDVLITEWRRLHGK